MLFECDSTGSTIETWSHGGKWHKTSFHQPILEGGTETTLTPKDALTFPNEGIHLGAEGRHIRNTFTQATCQLMKFGVPVKFQLIKLCQMREPGTILTITVIANTSYTERAITFTGHNLYGTTAGECSSLKAAFQLLTHVTQACTTDTNIGDQAIEALNTLF